MADLLADLPNRIGELATKLAARAAARPALVDAGGVWTYGDLPGVVGDTKAWLAAQGIRPGDRVMIVAENCRTTVALLLAAASLDAWPMIVNARLSDREIDQIRDLSGARRLLYTVSVSARARAQAARHGAVTTTVEPIGAVAIGPLNQTATPEPVETSGADQVATVIYTSGTTGTPKGVMLTHRNLLFVAKVSGQLRRLGPEDQVYGVLPASHVLGLSVVVLGALYHGATLHLTPRFDPAATLAAIEGDRLTFVIGAPSLFAMLAEYAKSKGIGRIPRGALRVAAAAGAPLDPATKEAAEYLLGLPLNNGYGVTECSPSISQTRLDRPRGDCSVGPVWPGVEVKLTGPDGAPVAPGEIGELRVRGPGLMKGYYRAPEETEAAFDGDGWFNTRDLARFEDDHLFIAGRAKELIVRFGFNVYPPEVETVLNAHPAVTQSAVIGRNAAGTEDIIAFVQPAPDSHISGAELADHAARQLAPYKRPTEIFVLPALPIGANGKILKSALGPLAEELLARKHAA
ncbi:MAG: class I adenylate-forming enzyme family protein [Stellaceae bacterium]